MTTTEHRLSQVLECLNTALSADRAAVEALCRYRVECSDQLSRHPLVVVGNDDSGELSLRLVGLLNGVLSALDMPLVAENWEEVDGKPARLLKFVRYTPPI